MSGFAALMGEEGDASDLIELKKKAKKKEEKDKAKAEAAAAAFSADLFSKKKSSTWAESDDDDDFFSKPVRQYSARQPAMHTAPTFQRQQAAGREAQKSQPEQQAGTALRPPVDTLLAFFSC